MRKINREKLDQKKKQRQKHRILSKAKKTLRPVLSNANPTYEIADRIEAIDCGAVGIFLSLARKTGLVDAINTDLNLLAIHAPYHESDHVLTVALNVLTGGQCIQDINARRHDETFCNALGTDRLPAPTTTGDFARRFSEHHVTALMDAINRVRSTVWKQGLPDHQRKRALIDVDGTFATTTGECKQGVRLNYKGDWSYHPLLVSLANTGEPLYLVNRPGNRPSHEGAHIWLDRALDLVEPHFDNVLMRGDTDFSQTGHLDRWDDRGTQFVFGLDSMRNLHVRVDEIPEADWKPLPRLPRHEVKTRPRGRRRNEKEAVVIERGYKNIKTVGEHVAEFAYQPGKCRQPYRVVVLRKNLTVLKGERRLLDTIRYFFYITNCVEESAEEIVHLANGRCNQENLIDQLKHGVKALGMPLESLVSNNAYMVMASLAWTLKAWFALLAPDPADRDRLLRMEFRGFFVSMMRLPCQILRRGGRLVYRLLSVNDWTETMLLVADRLRRPDLVFS